MDLENIALFLGLTISLGMFMSPILYNGDYKKPLRAVSVLMGNLFFSSLVLMNVSTDWVTISLVLVMVNSCYIIGLYVGVFIHNIIYNKAEYRRCKK